MCDLQFMCKHQSEHTIFPSKLWMSKWFQKAKVNEHIQGH